MATATDPRAGTRIRPGLCSITFRGLGADDVVARAEQAGIEGIEWGSDIHAPPGGGADVIGLGQRCRDAGIAVVSYGSYLGAGPAGSAVAADRATVTAVLDSAEALGAPMVRIWTEFGVLPDSAAADRERVTDRTSTLADAAAERSLTVALEFHPGTLTHTAGSTTALIDSIDRANLATHWQPDPALPHASALDELAVVLPHLAHVHTFSWGAGGIAERFALAEGNTLWPAALALVASRAPSVAGGRYALLEYVRDDDPEQFLRDAATLRRWLDHLPNQPGPRTDPFPSEELP